MAPRAAQRKARENDYSNVGKAGRRTGVTVPEGRRDEFGLEEITGIFSSPQKALQNATLNESTVEASEDMVGMDSTGQEPTTILSSRRSMRGPSLPRSASPRKTGITGTARRSDAFDLSPAKRMTIGDNRENTPPTYPTPIPINGNLTRRFSPEKSPLKELTANRSASSRNQSIRKGKQRESYGTTAPYEYMAETDHVQDNIIDPSLQEPELEYEEDNVIGVNDDDSADEYLPHADEVAKSVERNDLEAQLQSDAQEHSSPARAKGSRKRKSDDLESVKPNTKKARTTAAKQRNTREDSAIYMDSAESAGSNGTVAAAQPTKKGRTVGARKDPNVPLSTRQQKELDDVVERIKARPGKAKSLYILRRETPTDDSATHTRSGRVSVKPLAYWRNERCVYGDSGDVPEGSRFPLSTIKEIIRTEEVETTAGTKKKGGSKSKKGKRVARQQLGEDEEDEYGDEEVDDNQEPWETENGVYQGPVAQWDQESQRPLSSTFEMDIAYAASAIETREVRNATFRYAKLLSTPFFGSGIVDIPPGGEKREKNSRKMHMVFYVFEGRVTVTVAGNTFGVGKGGIWQVPRGNLYSIVNVLDRPARIFFSQGCVTTLDEEPVDA